MSCFICQRKHYGRKYKSQHHNTFHMAWKSKKYLQNYTKSIQQSQRFLLLITHFSLLYWVEFVKNFQGVRKRIWLFHILRIRKAIIPPVSPLLTLILCVMLQTSREKREERKERKRQQSEDVNAILCNSVKMIREKLTVSEGRFFNLSVTLCILEKNTFPNILWWVP